MATNNPPNGNGQNNRALVTEDQAKTQLAQQVSKAAIDPELIAAASLIYTTAQGEGALISREKAVAAAYQLLRAQERGEELGRDIYLGTSGNVAGQIIDGYQGLAKRIGRDFQAVYRRLTAEEREDRELQEGDRALACELEVYDMMKQARALGITYRPPTGYCILRKAAAQPRLPAHRDLRWWMEKTARKDALRQVPGLPQNPDEILEDAALEIDGFQFPPADARLTIHQARVWVDKQHSLAVQRNRTPEQVATDTAATQARIQANGLEHEYNDWQMAMAAPCPYCGVERETPISQHANDCRFRLAFPKAARRPEPVEEGEFIPVDADDAPSADSDFDALPGAADELGITQKRADAATLKQVHDRLQAAVSEDRAAPPDEHTLNHVKGSLSNLFGRDDETRHAFLRWSYKVGSTNDLTAAMCRGLIDFIGSQKVAGQWVPADHAIVFLRTFKRAVMGQPELL